MRPVRPITLTTDFGVQDWFVGTMKGVILDIDRFGNAITNLRRELFVGLASDDFQIHAGGKVIAGLIRFYQQVPPGRAGGIVGSSGLLEIAVNGGSAAQRLGLRTGDPILARLAKR